VRTQIATFRPNDAIDQGMGSSKPLLHRQPLPHPAFGHAFPQGVGEEISVNFYGETDEFGYKAVVNRVGVPDLHATILHLLGLDHNQLSYPYYGIPETPTDAKVNGAKVVGHFFLVPKT
jgi:hypothetical protein